MIWSWVVLYNINSKNIKFEFRAYLRFLGSGYLGLKELSAFKIM